MDAEQGQGTAAQGGRLVTLEVLSVNKANTWRVMAALKRANIWCDVGERYGDAQHIYVLPENYDDAFDIAAQQAILSYLPSRKAWKKVKTVLGVVAGGGVAVGAGLVLGPLAGAVVVSGLILFLLVRWSIGVIRTAIQQLPATGRRTPNRGKDRTRKGQTQ